MKVTWVASYPKSGNTWIRFFLYSYYYGIPVKSTDINNKIPDIHIPNDLKDETADRLFCKTHFAYSNRHPYVENTAASIYIIRHPKDVLLSNLNYFRLTGQTDIDTYAFAKSFIANKGVTIWQQAGMGNWPEHLQSWTEGATHPQLVLKYESIKQDPEDNFCRLIRFLDNQVDARSLKNAVLRSSFENMKRIENKEKRKNRFSSVFWGNTKTAEQGLRFLNKGGMNQSLKDIDPALDDEFDAAFASELKYYGYS